MRRAKYLVSEVSDAQSAADCEHGRYLADISALRVSDLRFAEFRRGSVCSSLAGNASMFTPRDWVELFLTMNRMKACLSFSYRNLGSAKWIT